MEACISIVSYLRKQGFDNLVAEWNKLTEKDKQDLVEYARAEGANISDLGVKA